MQNQDFKRHFQVYGLSIGQSIEVMISKGRLLRNKKLLTEMPQKGCVRLVREQYDRALTMVKGGQCHTKDLSGSGRASSPHDRLSRRRKPRFLVTKQKSSGRFRQIVDNTIALVQCTNSLEFNVWFSKAALGHRNGLRVRMYGTEGSAEWFQMEPEVIHFNDNRGHQLRIDRANNDVLIAHQPQYNRFKSGHPAGFFEALANLYTDIAVYLARWSTGESQISYFRFMPRHTMEVLVMQEAIERSERERRWIDLNLGEIHE